MARKPLRPEDVTPAQALAVLQFLNSAQTREEIAATVELPNEKDVGESLAARILAYREKNGAFTKIEQLLDVPLIGPSRFTQIVLSLTKETPMPIRPADDSVYQALLDEVRALRAALGAGAGRWTATVRAAASSLFLGQRTQIEAQVTDAEGRPQVGVPLTFTASAGQLWVDDGAEVLCGPSVVSRTGVNGTAQVVLASPSVERLTRDQQGALETALGDLRSDARAPAEMADALKELARLYRWDINVDLRAAIDVLIETYKQGLQAQNFVDPMVSFSNVDSTVVVYARRGGASDEAAAPTSVEAMAALNVRYKSWLGAFCVAYLGLLTSEGKLAGELSLVKQSGKTGAEMVSDIRERVFRFVRKEPGLAGEHVGQLLAEQAVQGFVADGLSGFSMDDVSTLISDLGEVSECLRRRQLPVLSAVTRAGASLRKNLGAVYDGRFANVEGALDRKADISAIGDVNELRQGVQAIAALQGDVADMKAKTAPLATYDKRLTTVEGSLTDLPELRQSVKEIATIKSDLADVRARVAKLPP